MSWVGRLGFAGLDTFLGTSSFHVWGISGSETNMKCGEPAGWAEFRV